MSAWTYRRLMARPPERLFHLVFESHSGRALVPSPKRSASPRATSTLQWWIGLKALDPERPIREADMNDSLQLTDNLRDSIQLLPSWPSMPPPSISMAGRSSVSVR
jgi:hypothetical protein